MVTFNSLPSPPFPLTFPFSTLPPSFPSSPLPSSQATGSRLSSMLETLTALVLALVIAFVYSWIMTLFMIGVVPVIIFGGVVQSQILSRNIARNKKALENAGMIAVDSIENIRTVAALGVEENFNYQYSSRITTMYRLDHLYSLSPEVSSPHTMYIHI